MASSIVWRGESAFRIPDLVLHLAVVHVMQWARDNDDTRRFPEQNGAISALFAEWVGQVEMACSGMFYSGIEHLDPVEAAVPLRVTDLTAAALAVQPPHTHVDLDESLSVVERVDRGPFRYQVVDALDALCVLLEGSLAPATSGARPVGFPLDMQPRGVEPRHPVVRFDR